MRPTFGSNEEACELIVKAIETAGYKPGKDIAIALDPAASSFLRRRLRAREIEGRPQDERRDDRAIPEVDRHVPDRFDRGRARRKRLEGIREPDRGAGRRIQIVGDDIFVTNPEFIARGVKEKAANAVLIKLNQIGTVTETVEAIELAARPAGTMSSPIGPGETEDTFLADFAVAMGGGQIKTGSASRSERIAKYNRLLEIEADLGGAAVFGSPFA